MAGGRTATSASLGPGLLGFLKELDRHNDRSWFLTNNARYEGLVQVPCLGFIAEVGPGLAKISPEVVADPRPYGGSMARIYRDIRFSKDKRPYNTHVGIHFAHADATKGEQLPGFFLHLSPKESMVASGIWHPDPSNARKIRSAIVATPDRWGPVLRKGLQLGGESYARVPRGFDPTHRYATDLRRKDFYASLPFTDSEVSSPEFPRTFLAACRTLDPLNRFLSTAIGVPW